jgi:predicted MFS family arabinose efflux permease
MRSREATDLRRRQTITLSLLFVAGVVNFFDRASLSVANNTVRAELHLNATEMGWLLSSFSLAYGFSQLPLIGLMRRVGGRWALGGGLGLWSTAQLLTGLVRGLPAFLVFRVLLGVGESPFYPAGVQSLREWFPAESRARATAVMNMSQTLALAAAPPVLTLVMLRVGWRGMFEGLGAVGLVVAVAWCWLYRARDGEAAAVESAWRVLLRQRTVWGMMLGFGGVNYTVWLYTAWIPGYLQTARHLSLARSGWVAAVPFLFGAAGMAASGVFTDLLVRRGARPVSVHRVNLVVGMVLSAAGTFVVVRSASTAVAVGGISAALFFIHFAGTSGWGYAQAIGGVRHSASLGALQNFASFTIASAAPVLTGWLLDRTQSFTLSLEACSAVTLLGALSYATLGRPSGTQSAE